MAEAPAALRSVNHLLAVIAGATLATGANVYGYSYEDLDRLKIEGYVTAMTMAAGGAALLAISAAGAVVQRTKSMVLFGLSAYVLALALLAVAAWIVQHSFADYDGPNQLNSYVELLLTNIVCDKHGRPLVAGASVIATYVGVVLWAAALLLLLVAGSLALCTAQAQRRLDAAKRPSHKRTNSLCYEGNASAMCARIVRPSPAPAPASAPTPAIAPLYMNPTSLLNSTSSGYGYNHLN